MRPKSCHIPALAVPTVALFRAHATLAKGSSAWVRLFLSETKPGEKKEPKGMYNTLIITDT